MREVLYRGKSAGAGGGWVYGVPYGACMIRKVQEQADGTLAITNCEKILTETRGEFTGRTDKNGVRIFEGDIVEDAELGRRTVIKWLDEYSCFAKTKGELFEYMNVFADYMEVIGNIYDNPELMGGEN